MGHETETKILAVDVADIAARLTACGAQKILDTKFSVTWFQPRGLSPHDVPPWFLRIRTDGNGRSELTWKGRSEVLGASRTHREISFVVSDPVAAGDFLEALDLEQYAYQEKYRTSWTLNGWRFDLDQYPGMPPYLEIEGQSEAHIQEAIALLGLQGHAALAEGETKIIRDHYGLDWNNMRFDHQTG